MTTPTNPPDLAASAVTPRRVFIKSYGCQMNVYDASRMADVLAPEGYAETDVMADADLVILNTCHIREKAAEKVYSELGRIRKMKRKRADGGANIMVAVAGCVAQAEGQEIITRDKVVDLVVGPQAYHRLPALMQQAKTHGHAIDIEFPPEDKFDRLPRASRARTIARGVSAFLTIQEGCDKFCTFCVVPYTRGIEVSRPLAKVLSEAEELASAGVREVTLLGQNVNAWHGLAEGGSTATFPELLRRVAEISGIDRVRYSTSHPRDMTAALVNAHRDIPQVMPTLHLPVQSGSDAILKAMNRKHTASEYLAIIAQMRETRPDIAFTSDFIVGFPGETDADFEATLRLVRDVRYAAAYSFKYSERPGTPAADYKTQVPEDIKNERLARLQALILEQQTAFNLKTVGQTLDVLFEKAGRNAGQVNGKTPYMQAVHVDAPLSLVGHIKRVKITGVASNSLAGTLVESDIKWIDSPDLMERHI